MSLVGRVCSQKFGTHAYMQKLTQQEKQKCKSICSAAQQAGCKILKSAEPPADLLSANAFKRSQSFSCKKTFLSSSAGLKINATQHSSCYCCDRSRLSSSSSSPPFNYLLYLAGFSQPALSHRTTSQLPAEIRAQERVTAEEIAPAK